MPKIKRKCKVCGEEYIVCSKAFIPDGTFNYRTVACCQECGDIYLQRLRDSIYGKKETDKTEDK